MGEEDQDTWNENKSTYFGMKTKSSNKPQLHIPGLQATRGLTWFRDGDIIVNHIWPDADRRKGIKVNTKPTTTPRPNTNAPKHKQTEEYHEINAMKKIQSAVEKQVEWQKQIDQQQQAAAEQNNANPDPQQA